MEIEQKLNRYRTLKLTEEEKRGVNSEYSKQEVIEDQSIETIGLNHIIAEEIAPDELIGLVRNQTKQPSKMICHS